MSAATPSPEEEAAFLADLRRGVREADADDPEAAERTFREVLAKTRGSGARAERMAVGSLVNLFARHGRDIETFLLARRHCVLAESGDAEDLCFALAGLLEALVQFEDWSRCDATCARYDWAITAYHGTHEPALRRHLARVRARRELARNAVAAAERQFAVVACLVGDGGATGAETRENIRLEAELALLRGEPAQALARLARAEAEPAPSTVGDFEAVWLSLRCAFSADGPRAAVKVAREHLPAFEAADARAASARMKYAFHIGELVAKSAADLDLAKRFYDAAATATLVRAAQIEDAVRGLPELSIVDGDDAVALAEYRRRFADARGALLSSVAELLRGGIEAGGLPEWATASDLGAVALCAWCARVRLPDGTMLPVGQFLPADPAGLRVSHGLCDSCRTRLSGPGSGTAVSD